MTPVPFIRGLLDTAVVIDYREGWPDPIAFFGTVRNIGFPEFSQITALKVLEHARDLWELDSAKVYLSISRVHPLNARVADLAQRLLELIPPPSPLSPDDTIVAATALIHKLPLYTLHPARFGIVPGLNTIQPY